MSRTLTSFVGSLACIVALACATGAWAQGGQAPAAYKIGVVDLKAVFDAYDRQEDEYNDLEQERDRRQGEIDKLSDKITKAKERYEAEKDQMSREELDALEEQIETDFGRYEAEFKRLQQEIDRKEQRILEDLFQDIRTAVQEVGAQGNYHLILEGGESGRSGVLYSSATLSITGRVIDYLNSKYNKS